LILKVLVKIGSKEEIKTNNDIRITNIDLPSKKETAIVSEKIKIKIHINEVVINLKKARLENPILN
jgi:hypothetical protein